MRMQYLIQHFKNTSSQHNCLNPVIDTRTDRPCVVNTFARRYGLMTGICYNRHKSDCSMTAWL